jgi:hypothetical protein
MNTITKHANNAAGLTNLTVSGHYTAFPVLNGWVAANEQPAIDAAKAYSAHAREQALSDLLETLKF